MAKPPAPSKLQQAVATNKAAQQARTERLAETNKKITTIQNKPASTPKAAPTPAAAPVNLELEKLKLQLAELQADALERQRLAEADAAQSKQQRQSAFALIEQEFTNMGLPEFAPEIKSYLTQGILPEEVPIYLSNSNVYKERFKGNQARRAKGLPELEPGQYIQAESDYRELLKSNNLSILDNKDTFAKLIGGDVSLAEAQDRIQKVFNKIDSADAALKEQVNKYFSGFGVGDPALQREQVAAAILGGTEVAGNLQKTLQKAQLRAGAQMAGLAIAETNVEELQKQAESAGVADVYGLAKQGFATLAQTQPSTEKLAQIYGEDTTGLQPELQQEALFGLASQRRKKLQEKEQATFAGQAGTSTVSLAQKSSAGQF